MRMEIFIGGQQARTDNATTPKITKQVIDIQNPENRKTDRTLTFSMPGTPENDRLFGGMFDVNLTITNDTTTQFNPDFNPNLRASFLLIVDTVTQLSGYCQLTDILIQRDNTVRYNVVAYGTTSDLFSVVGDKLLTDLDFSEYDHQWTKTNIINSWDTSIQVNGSPVAFELGSGYVYPMVDYGQLTNPSTWRTTSFFPALYFKTILDKIFFDAGFTYESDFFTSERFKRLIAPFTAGEFKVSNEDAALRLINVERITTDQNVNVVDNLVSTFTFTTGDKVAMQQENADPSNQWSADTFTTAIQGEYIFQGYADLAFRNNTGSSISIYTRFTATLALIKYDGATYTSLGTARSQTAISPSLPWANGNTSSSEDFWYSFPAVRLLVGEQVFLKVIYITADAVGASGGRGTTFFGQDNIQAVFKVGSYMDSQMGSNQLIDGDTIPMNSAVPIDVKQKDFLVSIIRAFNLYIEPDANISNRLLIEPREDYYISDSVVWTDKLSEGRDLTIEPMGLLDAETYLFQYGPDSDYLNKAHMDRFGYTYGRRKIVVGNQFVKSTKTVQTIFAPTPLAAPMGYADRIVPQIKFVDQNGVTSVKAAKMRMLYYGGLKSCIAYFFIGSGSSSIEQEYPYAGHLDDPKNPTFDLNFGAPAEIYYGAAFASVGQLQYTDNNLYRAYSKEFIDEITNKDSKVVSGYFHLKPSDIAALSFRKRFFIKETYYRLLSVNDYDPISNTPCLCKFLRTKRIPQAAAVTEDTSGGTGALGGDRLPTWDLPKEPNGNDTNAPGNAVIVGEDNTAAGGLLTAMVVGNGNSLLGNAENMIVLGGEDNLVMAPNVVVLNSQDQTITEADTTVINNIRYPVRIEAEVLSADMLNIGSTPVTLLLSPGVNRTIEVIASRVRRSNSSTGYSSESLVVRYTSGVICSTFATEVLTATGDNLYKATTQDQIEINTGIELTTQSGTDPTTGDGDYTFYIDLIIQNI